MDLLRRLVGHNKWKKTGRVTKATWDHVQAAATEGSRQPRLNSHAAANLTALGRVRLGVRTDYGTGPARRVRVSAANPPYVGGADGVGEPSDELERVYREQGARLWRAVLAFTGDREVASDAVAEAFAQALRRGEALRSPERWVWRAAFRIAAGELKDRRTQDALAGGGSYEMPDPRTDVLEALAELSPRQRAVVLLHDYAGYSANEAADILSSTAATVRVHLTRARRRLRHLLEDGDA